MNAASVPFGSASSSRILPAPTQVAVVSEDLEDLYVLEVL
jgi:hypothetical protein